MAKSLKKCVVLANGKPPSKSNLSFLLKNFCSSLFCADGGANTAKKMGFIPNFIVGDLDSINASTLQYFKEKSRIIKLSRQNDTDVEKCLKLAIKLKYDEAILAGVTGDRLDHTFCNLGIVLKFFNRIKIKVAAENSILLAVTGKYAMKTFPGEIISIYGIDNKTKISSRGLKYKLKNAALPFGVKESTSNVALDDKVELEVKGGVIFLVRDFHTMRIHGLLH